MPRGAAGQSRAGWAECAPIPPLAVPQRSAMGRRERGQEEPRLQMNQQLLARRCRGHGSLESGGSRRACPAEGSVASPSRKPPCRWAGASRHLLSRGRFPKAPGQGGVAASRPPRRPQRKSAQLSLRCRRMRDAGRAEQSMNERSGFLPPPPSAPQVLAVPPAQPRLPESPAREEPAVGRSCFPQPAPLPAAARPGPGPPGTATRGKPGGTLQPPAPPNHSPHASAPPPLCLARMATWLIGAMLGITSPHRCRGGGPKASHSSPAHPTSLRRCTAPPDAAAAPTPQHAPGPPGWAARTSSHHSSAPHEQTGLHGDGRGRNRPLAQDSCSKLTLLAHAGLNQLLKVKVTPGRQGQVGQQRSPRTGQLWPSTSPGGAQLCPHQAPLLRVSCSTVQGSAPCSRFGKSG